MTAPTRRWAAGLTHDDVPPFLLGLVFAALALCMPPHNDTWWHLRNGLEMVRAGGIVQNEVLSYTTSNAPLFHNHEWLSQLIFYALHATGGPFLLALAAAAAAMAAAAGSWRLVEGSADARFGWLALILAGTTIAWAVRPQVLSLALFVLALHLATSARERWLPVVLVVWANLHAVAVAGIVVAGCSALDAMCVERPRAWRRLAILAACVLATAVTPLGWHYLPRVVEVVHQARTLGINEYRPPLGVGQLPFWGCVVALAWLGLRSAPACWQSRRTRVLVMVAGVFAIAGILSIRNIPMFMLAAVPAMSRLVPTRTSRRQATPLPAAGLVVVACVAIAVVGGLTVAWRDTGARLGWAPMSAAAVEAVRRCEGPLFNGFADGGVLAWFVPERRIFVDSRGVEAYPVDLLQRSREADLTGRHRELFQAFGIECAAVETGSVMARALEADPAMRRVHSDARWNVFRRASRP